MLSEKTKETLSSSLNKEILSNNEFRVVLFPRIAYLLYSDTSFLCYEYNIWFKWPLFYCKLFVLHEQKDFAALSLI